MSKRTKEQISYNMSRIRSNGTAIEKKLGKAIWAAGLRYRKNYKKVEGKPDFVITKHQVVVFCDSSFWHGYKNMTTKRHNFKSNKEFWVNKISRNIKRDKEVNRILRREGWKVFRFWDFQIQKDVNKCVEKVLTTIKK